MSKLGCFVWRETKSWLLSEKKTPCQEEKKEMFVAQKQGAVKENGVKMA